MTVSARISRLQSSMHADRYCCYSPTLFNPLPGSQHLPATRAVLLDDLQAVRRYFSALITYSCSSSEGLALLPQVAAEVVPPYHALILGLWDINDPDEFETVVRLAREHADKVLAVCCGNEGLYFNRYSVADLRRQLDRLRKMIPDTVCLTTSEPVPQEGPYPVMHGFPVCFHHPTLHPWFMQNQRVRGPEAAADWVVERIRTVQAESGLPMLVKETGWPSGGAPEASMGSQVAFWRRLLTQTAPSVEIAWALFELFDAGDWKCITNEFRPEPTSRVEANWGFYTNSRNPKPVIDVLSPMPDR